MIEDNTYFEISESGNFIRIELLKLSHLNTEMDWDANWIKGFVKLKAGGFSGEFNSYFMTTDFISFKTELTKLYDKLNGITNFQTLENQVDIKIRATELDI
jgi:hypothetical protein